MATGSTGANLSAGSIHFEENHCHLHDGPWPHPVNNKWMQWTQSSPNVVDIDGDGKNEVVCVSNVEKDEPYDTKHHSIPLFI